VAKALGAVVQGDEGESYDESGSTCTSDGVPTAIANLDGSDVSMASA